MKNWKEGLTWKVGAIVLLIVAIMFATGPVWAAERDGASLKVGISSGINHTHGTVLSTGLELGPGFFVDVHALSERSGNGGVVYSLGRQGYFREGSNFSPFVGIGLAWIDDPPKDVVGCGLMWHLKGGVELWRIVQVEYAHNSSADRCDPNKGLDYVGMSFRWRF